MTDYGPATEEKIKGVVEACERYGDSSIIALAGVPGTGKSYIASIAAQRVTDEPLFAKEIQFHQSFSYEEFIEGMRISEDGVNTLPGIFLEWNQRALEDPGNDYVLLIEELTRADLSAVLGEVLTYLEYRDRPFETIYSRKPVKIAKNLTLIATYNPIDRSALELDNAVVRRLRIIPFPPSADQLEEMLSDRPGLDEEVITELKAIFDKCRERFPQEYEYGMPFGHGIFSQVEQEKPDLHDLWEERIKHLLRPPLREPHAFTETIEELYPWRDPDYSVHD